MDANDRAREFVRALYEADSAAHALGIELVDAGAGSATVRLEVDDRHLGSLGQMHGGVLFTLADVAMSYAGNSRGDRSMAIAASIDYVDATAVGEIVTATAVEHNLRGKAGIYDVTIQAGADDRLVATFRGNTLRVG